LGDAPRLIAIYGGNSEDWDKMTSIEAFEVNGYSVQVYWFRNSQTLQEVEFKFKRQYPKTAPKNLNEPISPLDDIRQSEEYKKLLENN
jgi:hypothetical protein